MTKHCRYHHLNLHFHWQGHFVILANFALRSSDAYFADIFDILAYLGISSVAEKAFCEIFSGRTIRWPLSLVCELFHYFSPEHITRCARYHKMCYISPDVIYITRCAICHQMCCISPDVLDITRSYLQIYSSYHQTHQWVGGNLVCACAALATSGTSN